VRQLGKPYLWAAAGPDAFDCSGLTLWAWRAAGVRLSHSAEYQFGETARVALADLRPGDLLFYGTPIHHVGMYVGADTMIEAPHTGAVVRYRSIWRRDLVGAGRPD
jgi:cell wall-associated NlpC family hydrolase